MTDFREDSNNQEKQNDVSEKKYPVSAGTVVFLVFNFLLISGFCKFSFYILKNHRSAVDRDSFVGTYVDVQPYSGQRNEKSSYIILKSRDATVPAPFFINNKTENKIETFASKVPDNALTAPFPVVASGKLTETSPVEKIIRRPPVIRSASAASAPAAFEETAKPENNAQENDFSENLDDLMAAGLSLLTESDEKLIATNLLLEENAFLSQKKENSIASSGQNAEASSPAKPQKTSGKEERETKWVDVNRLRQQLSARQEEQKEEIRQKNAALLEMNDSRQTASLDTQPLTDVAETPEIKQTVSKTADESEKKAVIADKNNSENIIGQTAVVQDVPFAGTSDAQEKVATNKNSVVQDVPFAGTSDAQEKVATNKNTALSGTAASLWKIATVHGKTQQIQPVEQKAASEKTNESAVTGKQTLSETKQEKAPVIYRNGKMTTLKNEANKSLNWLDRQEAAVWTSMSQSDTPSVWSTAADSEKVPADRAKAFRIADEQSVTAEDTSTNEAKENEVINSVSVRHIGEDTKPEAKKDPLLLPLGTPSVQQPVSGQAAPLPTQTQKTAQTQATPVVSGIPPQLPANPVSPKTENAEDTGLVDKLFSFFGKTESDTLPTIGSGTPVEKETDKNKSKNALKNKGALPAGKPSSFATAGSLQEKQFAPTELRLTFKPDSTEMSAQSVKWIKSLGQRVKKDIQNAVEVRMSNLTPELQKKRFALIYSTLTGVGVEDVQIIPVMTDRTPHTVVLRMITLPEEGYTEYTSEVSGVKERMYYKKW